jgi:hypothetical protein
MQSLTTLVSSSKPDQRKRISVPFYPAITNKLKPVFKRNNIDLVTSSADFKLKNNFSTTKDVRMQLYKSEIYEVKCTKLQL